MNFKLQGDDYVKVYYFPYKGYGPAIQAGKETCQFMNTNEEKLGQKDVWYYPNHFGGACAYMLLIGIDEDAPASSVATITL